MTQEERLKICKACPLMKLDSDYGPICDNTKWMNPNTGETSSFPHGGGIRGCACKLKGKTANPSAHCIAKKG